jgi:Pro-kumamolisin, activation domain
VLLRSARATIVEPSSTRSRDVRAQIVLKGTRGDLTSGQQISAANIEQFISDPEKREHVRHILEESGFAIESVGPFSISVSAPRRRFEQLFGSRLHQEGDSARSWNWEEAPEIPEELRDAVSMVVFPQPTRTTKG